MRTGTRLSILVSATFLFTPSITRAFSFSPMSVNLDPSGAGATRSFQLENSSDEPIAIEATIARRVHDAAGVEKQITAAEEPQLDSIFQIYPPQLILKAKEKRTLRVSYLGAPDARGKTSPTLASEQSYRLIVEQLPVDAKKRATTTAQGATIRMLLKYVAAIYVTPPGAKPGVKLAKATVVAGPKGDRFQASLRNEGSAHQVVTGARIKLPKGVVLEGEALAALKGQNILAGEERVIDVAAPKGLTKGPVSAELELLP